MSALPTLHGDGTHDDTLAVQAFMNGERVWSEQLQREVRHPEEFPHGTHLVTAITVPEGFSITEASPRCPT